RLKALYAAAMGLASADSLRQRIASTVSRLDGFEHYGCHFCRSREMDLQRSVVATGKREAHRTYGYNSTTIHYMVKASIIPRCARCSDLHDYLWEVTGTMRATLGVAAAAAFGLAIWQKPFGNDVEPMAYIILAAITGVTIWVVSILARWTVAVLATPRGE